MRSLVWIAALALAAAGCGKQLNAEFCAQNPHDQDCINAGLTFIDAPTPCSSDEQCAGMAGQTVCDTTKSECVECTPSDQASCAGTSSPHCGPDDRCHECVVDADCVGGICLPQQVCASSDSFLYAAPNAAGNCKMPTPCTLKTAIGMLDVTHRVISVAVGDYKEGPLTISAGAVLIGQGVNGDPTATTVTNAPGQNGPVVTVAGAQVALDYLSVYGSPDSDGATCTSGEINFHGSATYMNAGYGITASGGCALDVDRSTIHNNTEAALAASGSPIQVVNNFMFDNGNGNMNGGAVRLGTGTTGYLAYNSISFNHFKASNTDGGFTCSGGGSATVEFNIIAGNDGKQSYTAGGCMLSENFVGQKADMVHYASMVAPYDLHLTPATAAEPAGADPRMIYIRDNTHTTCVMKNITVDIDNDSRPQHVFCDLGADEYK